MNLANNGARIVISDMFPHPLNVVDNPITRCPAIAYSYNDMTMTDPSRSQCGRFDVDVEDNGLTPAQAVAFERLNKAIDVAVESMLNTGALIIQNHLGVTTGDVAGMVLTDEKLGDFLRTKMAEYAVHEVVRSKKIDPEEADIYAGSDPETQDVDRYLLVLHGDVEPELIGPMADEKSRRIEAARFHKQTPEDGAYRINVTKGASLSIEAFSGYELMSEDQLMIDLAHQMALRPGCIEKINADDLGYFVAQCQGEDLIVTKDMICELEGILEEELYVMPGKATDRIMGEGALCRRQTREMWLAAVKDKLTSDGFEQWAGLAKTRYTLARNVVK